MTTEGGGRESPPCVFIYANQGSTVRYLLRTDVLPTLEKSGARIVILAHTAEEPGFREAFESENVVVEQFALKACERYLAGSKLQRVIKLHRYFVINGHYHIQTLEDFNKIWLGEQGWGSEDRWPGKVMGLLWNGLRRLLMWSQVLRRGLTWFESEFFTPRFHRELFEKYKPDLVVVSSPGWWDYDQYLLREARKENVRTAAVILSWDNPTSLGMAGASADHVVAWTEVMAKELETLHDVPKDRISIGGVAHWDPYYEPSTHMDRQSLFHLLGLDPERKTLFFATKSPTRFPWAPEITENIACGIQDGRFDESLQLLVRLHPIYFRRINGELRHQGLLEAFSSIEERYPFVVVNKPDLRSDVLNCDLSRDEARLIASILKNSDVMVNMFSTMVIEAAIFDLPAVNLAVAAGFDSLNKGRSRQDIQIDYVQTHNQRAIQTGGVKNVFSMDELFDAVNAYLRDPSLDAEGRAEIRRVETGPFRGSAGRKVGEHLLSFAQQSSGSVERYSDD